MVKAQSVVVRNSGAESRPSAQYWEIRQTVLVDRERQNARPERYTSRND
jgi:hypothetical protein